MFSEPAKTEFRKDPASAALYSLTLTTLHSKGPLRSSLLTLSSMFRSFKCHVALFEWAVQPAKSAPDSVEGSSIHAALVMERGPLDVFRFPVRNSGGRLRARDVVKHYLEDGTPEKASARVKA